MLQGTFYEIIEFKDILKSMGNIFRFIIDYDAKYESAVRRKALFDPASGRGFEPDGYRRSHVFSADLGSNTRYIKNLSITNLPLFAKGG
jgi:hypothetical protein